MLGLTPFPQPTTQQSSSAYSFRLLSLNSFFSYTRVETGDLPVHQVDCIRWKAQSYL